MAQSPALTATLGATAAWAEPIGTVKSVRVGEHPGYTRIVVEADTGLDYTVFALDNPYRIVIDISEVNFALPRIPRGVGLIADVRYGQFREGTSRIVLETSKPVEVSRSFALEPDRSAGHRLAIDLRASTRDRFAASLNRPLAAGTAELAKVTVPPSGPTQTVSADAATAPTSSGNVAPENPPLDNPFQTNPLSGARPATAAPLAIVGTASAAPTLQTSNPARGAGVGAQIAALPGGLIPNTADRREVGRKPVIVLDAGHGGIDTGAIGRGGTKEKDLTLRMARELRQILQATGRYQVELTRDDDRFIKLRDRIAIGEQKQGDVFISIHADSIHTGEIRGLSVYTLSTEASDREAAALASRENKADLLQNVDLSQYEDRQYLTDILLDMSLDGQMKESNRLAHKMTRELGTGVRLLPNAKRSAGFAVLKSPNMTSVLIELGYLSNKKEENLLNSADHRRKLGQSILSALDAFFAPQ